MDIETVKVMSGAGETGRDCADIAMAENTQTKASAVDLKAKQYLRHIIVALRADVGLLGEKSSYYEWATTV